MLQWSLVLVFAVVAMSSVLAADLTLVHDDYYTGLYANDLNAGASGRESGALLTSWDYVPYTDNRPLGQDWQLAIGSSVPEGIKMALETGYGAVSFGFDKDWKIYDHIRVDSAITPDYVLGGYSQQSTNWVGFAFAGPSLSSVGSANCVSFKLEKNGTWAAYNYSATPFATGAVAGVTDSGQRGLTYNLQVELWKVDTAYHFSIKVNDGSWRSLVADQVVAGTFSANYLAWSGGGVEAGKTTGHGFDDLIVTAVRGQFGKKWVREHPFTISSWYELDNDPIGSKYTGFGPNAIHCRIGTTANCASKTADSFGLEKHRMLDAIELDEAMRSKILNNSSPWEGSGWYVKDEPRPEYIEGVGRVADFLKAYRPNALIYSKDELSGWGDPNYHAKMTQYVDPDIMMFDYYPFIHYWNAPYPPFELTDGFFNTLSIRRGKAISNGVPLFAWVQAIESWNRSFPLEDHVPGARFPSESELRMQTFSCLAAGCKGINYFFYEGPTNGDPALSNALVWNGVIQQPFYGYVQTLNPELKNLGHYLRFLESTDYRFVPGLGHTPPTGISNWAAEAGGDPHITAITVNGTGTKKDGLIGLFTDDAGQRYFLMVNLYRDPGFTASQTPLSFTITFDNSTNRLYRINRITRLQETVDLTNHQLTLTLPGGTGDLYSYGQFSSMPPGPPGTPTDTGLYTKSSSITFNWTAPSDAGPGIVSFNCQVGTHPGDSGVFSGNVGSSLSKTISGCQSGATYYCRVQAIDILGRGGTWSDASDGIMVDFTPPGTPGRPVDAGAYTKETYVTFTWTPAADAGSGINSYNCRIGTSVGGSDESSAFVGNTLSKTITGSNGVTYYCRVYAKDNGMSSVLRE